MEMLDLPKEAVLAIGDNGNDVSMFREAGVSVAVGNALPEIQAAADFVCGTNDEDGRRGFWRSGWLQGTGSLEKFRDRGEVE